MGTARFASLCCGATYDQKLAVSTSPMSTRGGRGGWAGELGVCLSFILTYPYASGVEKGFPLQFPISVGCRDRVSTNTAGGLRVSV